MLNVALANGAKSVVPFESSEDAIMRSKQMERGSFRLAGERRMLRMEGFDLGNSPVEHSREAIQWLIDQGVHGVLQLQELALQRIQVYGKGSRGRGTGWQGFGEEGVVRLLRLGRLLRRCSVERLFSSARRGCCRLKSARPILQRRP